MSSPEDHRLGSEMLQDALQKILTERGFGTPNDREPGGMVTEFLCLVNYLADDGAQQWAILTNADQTLSKTAGLVMFMDEAIRYDLNSYFAAHARRGSYGDDGEWHPDEDDEE